MPDSADLEVAIFSEALGRPPEERAAYLDQACAGNPYLQEKVSALLATYGEAGDFLESPASARAHEARRMPSGEQIGDRIDRYRLRAQIGEGGHGVVFLADQETPVQREVALKIIKPGMDSRSVIARFEAERQALALMDHPHIARIFDAGTTQSGRPYFVMELVRGPRITDYCDQQRLNITERLRLFILVCQAVQHAHQKGIIHRDIKPSNVLVTRCQEHVARPVVIDFGIAKAATPQSGADASSGTILDRLIGTPAYMSPEQATLTRMDVDTRTDIYSLGVLLYELLTGATPFDTAELQQGSAEEVCRIIREHEPLPPTTRLLRSGESRQWDVARRRSVAPGRLARCLRGDLEWIVMRALRKDRADRYQTANGLALDVERFLAQEPIQARPPTPFYRFTKAVQRNKILFAGVIVVAAGVVTSLILIWRTLAQEQEARRLVAIALTEARADKLRAEAEAAKSTQVTRFLEDLLESVGPSVARGRDTALLQEVLDRAAEKLGPAMATQPEVEAELRGVIGRLYCELGRYEQAEHMHAFAVARYRDLPTAERGELAQALADLGEVYWKQRKLSEAETVHREAWQLRERQFGANHSLVADSLNSLGAVYRRQGRLDEAEELTRRGLQLRQKAYGPDHLKVAESLRFLSIILGDQGQREAAESTARQMLAMRRRILGNDHPLVASALNDVAWAAGYNGKNAEARALESEALDIQRRILGDSHPDVAQSMSALGSRMRQQGDLSGSSAVLNAALSIQRKILGVDHPATLDSLRSLRETWEQQGRWSEVELASRELLSLRRFQEEVGSPRMIEESEALGRALLNQAKLGDLATLLGNMLTPDLEEESRGLGLVRLRRELRARTGQWDGALADTLRLHTEQPRSRDHLMILAALYALKGEEAAFADLGRRYAEMDGQTTDVFAADGLAKSTQLLPSSAFSPAEADRLIDLALVAGQRDENALPYFQSCKALTQYRLGRFAEAIAWARLPLASTRIQAQAPAYAVLALAHWQQGQPEEARSALQKGESLAPPLTDHPRRDDLGAEWLAWVYGRILLNEAQRLIPSVPGSSRSPAK